MKPWAFVVLFGWGSLVGALTSGYGWNVWLLVFAGAVLFSAGRLCATGDA